MEPEPLRPGRCVTEPEPLRPGRCVTEPEPLIVLGGGEHATVVLDAALANPSRWLVMGFIDPRPCEAVVQRLGVRQIGNDDDARGFVGSAAFVLGIGALTDVSVRVAVARRYDGMGARWATVVHPRAHVAPSATLDEGTFVAAGAIINPGSRIGSHGVVNTGSVVEHDCQLGSFVQVGPGAVLGGAVAAGDGAIFGLGCRVRDHVRIGAGVVVGMGAVVTRTFEQGVVVGVPARHRANP